MQLAKEFQKGFKGSLTKKPGGIDLAVTVLTTIHWPSYKKSTDLNLPREMVQCVEAFNSYYQSITTARKLSWIYSLGTCHVIGSFDPKPIELVLSTYQVYTYIYIYIYTFCFGLCFDLSVFLSGCCAMSFQRHRKTNLPGDH